MAVRDEEIQEDVTEKRKGSRLKKWLVIVILLGLFAGGGYAGWSFYFEGKYSTSEAKVKDESVIGEMDTFLVNLADPGGKRYLKITMKLVLDSAQAGQEFAERGPELRDNVLMLLSSKKYEDIATFSGKMALKQEAIARLNQRMNQGRVKDVYFTEFLVQ